MATAVRTNETSNAALVAGIQRGVIAGLVGGGIFGVQMTVAGMMPMIAGMVGSESVVVGFILHMLISAFIGGSFAVIASRVPFSLTVHTVAGFVWGLVWWVLGALIIMPTVLGMGEMVFAINDMSLGSLIGHSIFGLLLGVIYYILTKIED